MIRKHWLLITVVLLVPVLILLLAVGGYFVVWPWLTPAVAKPRPVITVEAVYPGANAQIVADAVAAPVEQQFNGVENMVFMHSQCGNDGSYTLNVTFKHGVNPDFAQVLVRNRVDLAHPVLPDAVKKTGITVRKRSLNAVMFVVVSSPDNSRDILYLGNYANIQLRDELARLPGAGDITVIGAREFGMRICLDLERMAACNVTVSDVTKAIKEQPVADLQQIENINLKAAPDRMVRLKDVARAELGMDYPASFARLNGKPVVVLGVYPMPLSSPRELNVAVQNKLSEQRGLLPDGIAVDVAFNFTPNLVASNLGTPPEYLRLDISLPDGVSAERTQEAVKHCEQLLNEVAGVQDILALSVPPFTASSNQAGILLHLAPAKQRQAHREQLMQTIRARLRERLPEAQARVCDVTKSSRFPLGGYPIELAIQGPELDKVRRLAHELADRLRQSEKLTDVGTSGGCVGAKYRHDHRQGQGEKAESFDGGH